MGSQIKKTVQSTNYSGSNLVYTLEISDADIFDVKEYLSSAPHLIQIHKYKYKNTQIQLRSELQSRVFHKNTFFQQQQKIGHTLTCFDKPDLKAFFPRLSLGG